MGSRYGRNQKRHHRQRIAELEQAADDLALRERAAMQKLGETRGRIEHWAYSIRSILGPDHPFNEEVKKRVVKDLSAFPPRMMVRYPEPMTLQELSAIPGPIPESAAVATLDVLVHRLVVRREKFNVPRAIFMLVAEDGQANYAIDDNALIEGRRDPRFVEWLAGELTRTLIHATGEKLPGPMSAGGCGGWDRGERDSALTKTAV